MQMIRGYLDWNATTPLCADAKVAMIAAMELVGNPSSVHREGRAVKSIIETARSQVAEAFGASGADIVFTSSATEAAALAMQGRDLHCGAIEHDAVKAWAIADLPVNATGMVDVEHPGKTALQFANSETGIVQQLPPQLALTDATQAFGKIATAFSWTEADMAILSAHKLGGPKGVGALVLKQGQEVQARIKGGGQEMGRRAGTENVIGIAGFGAAAKFAATELADGVWEQVSELRDLLEETLADAFPDTIFVGQDEIRLPNTSCIVSAGWKGETQVMLMDLSGFAISAGSACSSGKVKTSLVLQAMGYDEIQSSCAIRVSLGPKTTKDGIQRFANTWINAQKKFRAKAA